MICVVVGLNVLDSMVARRRNLQDTRVGRGYLQLLWEGYVLFNHFCLYVLLESTERLCEVADSANRALVAYIQYAYDHQIPFKKCLHGVLGTQHLHKHLRGKLRTAWESIQSWSDEIPSKLRTPITAEILEAAVMACRLAACNTTGLAATEFWGVLWAPQAWRAVGSHHSVGGGTWSFSLVFGKVSFGHHPSA